MISYIDLLTDLNIQFLREGHHHCRPGWIQMDCPYCGKGTSKYHLGLNESHGYCNCWRCGPHSLIKVLEELSGLTTREIYPLLQAIPRRIQTREVPKTGHLKLPKHIGELTSAHKRYLTNRGFDPQEITELWGVGGIGLSSHLGWRLFIPVAFRHETVSWTTRAIGNAARRYISASPEEETIQHKSLLYGEDLVAHAIVIVEGPLDAWRIGPGAVATFGLSYTSEQIMRMKHYPIRVVCFDKGQVEQAQAKRLADTLSLFPGETYSVVLDSKDPGTASRVEIKRLRQFLQ